MAGAFSIGSVVATIQADTKGFKQGIAEAKRGIGSFKESAVSGLTSVRNASAVATAGIAAVGAVSLSLAKDAGRYESIRDAFSGMTEGMGFSVDEFETKVADASRNTIDDLTILQNANKALALIGKESFGDFGNDFAKMAELSKKAARATGQDVDFMFESLVTGIARESKLILDNLGVTVDITAAKERYAESLGKSKDQLTESEAKTAVLNEVMGKLDSQYKDVAVSSGGFQGAMQTLQTTLTNAKIQIGTELIPVFNDLVRELTPLIQEWVPKLIELIKSGIEWFRNLSPPMQKIILAFIALAPVITVVTGVILALIPVIGALLSPIGLVVLAIIGLAVAVWANWNKIKSYFEQGRAFVQNIMEKIKNFLGNIGGKIKEALIKPFSDAWDRIKELAEKIKNKLDFTKRESPSVIDTINKSVREAQRAFRPLEAPLTVRNQLAGVATGSANTSSSTSIVVNLDGAIISGRDAANELGERIGDSIIKKLQQNVRM